jgi:tetratricopeptide (TPR) repeat protein
MTDHFQLAEAFFEQGKFEKACEKYEQAVVLQSDHVEAYIGWGSALNELTKYEEAISKYQKAIELNLDYSKAYFYWGNSLYCLKKYEEAITKYQKATELKPDYSEAYNSWGIALIFLNQYEEAITQYQKVIELNPNYFEVYYLWGITLDILNKYEEAITQYQKVIELNPNYSEAYNSWGNALFYLKQYVEAITQYQKATELNPDYSEAYNRWGNALFNLNEYEEAIKKYNQALEIDSDNVRSSYNIALIYWKQGAYKEARKRWKVTAKIYERLQSKAEQDKNATHFFFYGIILENLNELDRAEKQYKKGLEIDPNNIGILTNLVNFYLNKKEQGLDDDSPSFGVKARQYYLKARNLLQDELNQLEDTTTLLNLATLLSMDEYQEAENYLLKALEKDSDVANIYTNLGRLSVSKENFREATDYFKKVLKIEPYDLDIWSNLAEAYLKLKQLSQAESEYRKILSIAPCHVESHIGLGEVYIEMAQESDVDLYSQAIRHFTKAISISDKAEGSKQLSKKELAEVQYSRAYARVQFYESSTVTKDEKLLSEALKDFQNCVKNDPEHYKGRRATEKLQKQTNILRTQNLFQLIGTLFILLPSLSILVVTQYFFWKPFVMQDSNSANHQYLTDSPKVTSNADKQTPNKNKPKETIKLPEKVTQPTNKINTTEYFLLTFGSLTFSLISLYLPQLLKLKIGGTGGNGSA